MRGPEGSSEKDAQRAWTGAHLTPKHHPGHLGQVANVASGVAASALWRDNYARREREGGVDLTEKDKRILEQEDWLNDNHISAVSIILRKQYPDQNELCTVITRCQYAIGDDKQAVS